MAKKFPELPNLVCGKDTFYNGNIFLKGRGKIEIGSYCAFGDNLRIIAGNNHNYNLAAIQVSFYRSHFGGPYPGAVANKGVKIGSDVWIGDNCTILDGTHIGNGCCIAAGAVVKGEFPDYSIIGGIPGKVIRMRFPQDVCDVMSELAWWDWDREKIVRNRALFFTDLNELNGDAVRTLVAD